MSGWAAVAQAAGDIGSSLISARASRKATEAQSRAEERALEEQRRQYDLTRGDQMPWLQEGQGAIRTIGELLRSGELFPNFKGDNLTSEPGYQFRLNEGQKAIENAARARGVYMSPVTVKELLRYGQDYASGEYQNAYNRDMANKTTKFNMLSGAAGTGQTAANALATTGQNTVNNIGQLMTSGANARGAAGIARANAWSNAASNISNRYQQQSMLDRILNSGRPGANQYATYGGQNLSQDDYSAGYY